MKQENGKRAMTAGLRRTMVIFVLDLLCIAGSFFLALWMRFEFRLGAIPQMYLNEYLKIIGPWIVICLVVFQLFRLYNSIWSFVSIDELFRIILAYGVLLAAGLAYVLILKIDMPRSFYFAGFIMSFMSTTALRFSYRFMRQLMAGISTEKSERDRILMIGAGEAGRQLIREINSNPRLGSRVVCIIDDNPSKRRRYLDGVEIAGGRQEIPDAVKKYQVNKIIFAIPTCDGQDRKEILDICSKTGCRVQAVPGMFQLVNGEVSVSKLRDVELQDLLGRDPIQVNLEEICRYISGKVVMVTGGGGSIGSVSMLKKYDDLGWKRWMLYYTLCDETFSVVSTVEPPEGVDTGKFYLSISLLNWSYWIMASMLGGVLGGVLPFDISGMDFALTALFVVLFLEQLRQKQRRLPGAIGIACAVVALLVCGPDNLVIPSMVLIFASLMIGRKKLCA